MVYPLEEFCMLCVHVNALDVSHKSFTIVCVHTLISISACLNKAAVLANATLTAIRQLHI